MPNRFIQITVSTLILMGFAGSSLAQTPKEVLEPYKAYRTALDNNKKDVAADFPDVVKRIEQIMIDEHETHPLTRWQLPGIDDPKVDNKGILESSKTGR